MLNFSFAIILTLTIAAPFASASAETKVDKLVELCKSFGRQQPAMKNSIASLVIGYSYRTKPPHLKLSIGEVPVRQFLEDPKLLQNHCKELFGASSKTDRRNIDLKRAYSQDAPVDLTILDHIENVWKLETSCAHGFGASGLDPLKRHVKMEELEIADSHPTRCPPIDLSPIATLKQLQSLKVYRSEVSGLRTLRESRSLVTLDLIDVGLKNADDLDSLTQLRELDLSENPISDISGLMPLINLRDLSLRNCPNLNTIDVVRHMVNISTISAWEGSISSLEGLEELVWLSYLGLARNKIRSVKPLANLHNLGGLNLEENAIEDAEHLSELRNLTSLMIQSNRSSNFGFIDHLVKDGSLCRWNTHQNPVPHDPPRCESDSGSAGCPECSQGVTITIDSDGNVDYSNPTKIELENRN